MMHPRQRRARIRRLKNQIISYCIYFSVIIFLLLFLINLVKQEGSTEIISPLPDSVSAPLKIIETAMDSQIFPSSDIEVIIKKELEGADGMYGVYFKDLKTGSEYALNGDRSFETASLYKLFVMAKAYEDMNRGTLKKSNILKDTVERLNERFRIATEEAELTEGEFEMSVDTAIHQMITISHNYSALLLTTQLKVGNINEFLKRYGFEYTRLGNPPRSTPREIGLFFEKLYKGELIDSESSREMLEILKQQKLNDRIPKPLPTGTVVAHKTGELGPYKHDAGIVYTPKGEYILVLLSETSSHTRAIEREVNISKAVYDYYMNK